jgi:hypothetical protein
MAWITGAAILGGSLLSGSAARSAASRSADAQQYAADRAAEAARFRPVGVTTRFGTSSFQTSPEGYVTGAGYTVSPELKAYQDRVMALAGQGLNFAEQAPGLYAPLTGAATGLFNLGQQYLGQSPEQVAADYIAKQQALLAPGRERESAQLMNQLSNTGRTGLSIAQGGGLQAANPEFAALANARAMQDLQLAADAQEAGQRNVAFGTGLFGTGANLLGSYGQGLTGGYAPFTTGLGLTGSIEDLGRGAFDIGANLGGRNINATGANALLQGGLSAARTAQQGAAYSPWGSLFSGLGSNQQFTRGIGNWMSGGSNSQGYGSINPITGEYMGSLEF